MIRDEDLTRLNLKGKSAQIGLGIRINRPCFIHPRIMTNLKISCSVSFFQTADKWSFYAYRLIIFTKNLSKFLEHSSVNFQLVYFLPLNFF